MKYLSWALIVLAMSWTFNQSQISQALPLRQHDFLVQELKDLIVDYLVENVSEVEDITFHRFFTEITVPQQRIGAYVKYSYVSSMDSGAKTRELREGEFDLISADNGQTWEPHAVNFKDLNLEFLEGLRVTPGEPTEADPTEASLSE